MFTSIEASKAARRTDELASGEPSVSAAEQVGFARVLGNPPRHPQHLHRNSELTTNRQQGRLRFLVLWVVIAAVSAFDVYVALRHEADLFYTERNLIGRYLLHLDGGRPSLFLSMKFLGSMLLLGILTNIYHCRPKLGLMIAIGVATFQLGMLAYFTLA